MTNPDYNYCTICGMSLQTFYCVVFSGPHWYATGGKGHIPEFVKVADEDVTRYDAVAHTCHAGTTLLPDNEKVYTQEEVLIVPQPEDPSAANAKMYIAIHPACETLANRLFTTSSNPHVRSIGDLWLTLERRCEAHRYLRFRNYHFYPTFVNKLTGQRDFEGYYLPDHILNAFGDEWEGWWDEDPVDIPDLTTSIVSNLEKVGNASNTQIKNLIEVSPNEISDHIRSFVLDVPLSLECTYMMAQHQWAEVFFKIPFLWDLDVKLIHEKTGSSRSDLDQWNWEKLTRQILGPLHGSIDVTDDNEEDIWSYSEVGLDVPGALSNRRRIWQILLDMDPDFERKQTAEDD
ncbi:hypothetical protein FLONG3_7217 [Fusarium longipes]|uniref:Uncharacterized protein n=1 Tax=Fusarium longipes TaxID=694270 RepID=A0A395SGN5_9HYPO|nr:hypothetical protein FLONG3_7217 [Fusarium longipes]